MEPHQPLEGAASSIYFDFNNSTQPASSSNAVDLMLMTSYSAAAESAAITAAAAAVGKGVIGALGGSSTSILNESPLIFGAQNSHQIAGPRSYVVESQQFSAATYLTDESLPFVNQLLCDDTFEQQQSKPAFFPYGCVESSYSSVVDSQFFLTEPQSASSTLFDTNANKTNGIQFPDSFVADNFPLENGEKNENGRQRKVKENTHENSSAFSKTTGGRLTSRKRHFKSQNHSKSAIDEPRGPTIINKGEVTEKRHSEKCVIESELKGNVVNGFTLDGGESSLRNECCVCREPIVDKFMFSVNQSLYHGTCLKCVSCEKQMDSCPTCFFRAESLYCKPCYLQKYQAKCISCNRQIQSTDWVRRAKNFLYHLACFSCDHCKRQLSTGEQFSLQANRLLCKQHYMELVQGEDGHSKQKTKRVRTTFSEEQIDILQAHFQIDCNPDGADLERIAQLTGLSKRVTQVWFQNSRARQKKYQGCKKNGLRNGSGNSVTSTTDATSMNSGRCSSAATTVEEEEEMTIMDSASSPRSRQESDGGIVEQESILFSSRNEHCINDQIQNGTEMGGNEIESLNTL